MFVSSKVWCLFNSACFEYLALLTSFVGRSPLDLSLDKTLFAVAHLVPASYCPWLIASEILSLLLRVNFARFCVVSSLDSPLAAPATGIFIPFHRVGNANNMAAPVPAVTRRFLSLSPAVICSSRTFSSSSLDAEVLKNPSSINSSKMPKVGTSWPVAK